MAKLVMFSGGVESTALMSQLNPSTDYALVVKTYCTKPHAAGVGLNNNIEKNYDDKAIREICDHYKFWNLVEFEFKYSPASGMTVGDNQRWWLYPALLAIVHKIPAVDEVQFGFNAGEDLNGMTGSYAKYKKFVAEMMPNLKITEPLAHLTKRQQIEMIDPKVIHHVISCYTKDDPGHDPELCYKCKEVAAHMEM